MNRVYNFAAGPSMLPEEALEQAAREMLSYGSTGMSVMEMSHRSKGYIEIFDHTVSLLRELMGISDDYEVLLLQGGATGQFAAIPMNLLQTSADYVDSGNFAHGALVEAQKYGKVNVVASSRDDNYTYIPKIDPENVSKNGKNVRKNRKSVRKNGKNVKKRKKTAENREKRKRKAVPV